MLYLSPSDVDQAHFADAEPEINLTRLDRFSLNPPACILKDRLDIR